MTTILAVAAETREFEGILRRVETSRKLRSSVTCLMDTTWKGDRWLLAANGPGPRLSKEAMLAGLEQARPDAVLSTGYCGALAHSFAVADIFVARSVSARDLNQTFDASAPSYRDGGKLKEGALLSVDRVAGSAEEKAALGDEGFSAVEMEAASVAQLASERSLPFYCIRAVSDRAGESLPLDFNAYRDREGRFRRSAIAGAAMRSFSVAKDLMRLDRQCREASEALGDFLANCRLTS